MSGTYRPIANGPLLRLACVATAMSGVVVLAEHWTDAVIVGLLYILPAVVLALMLLLWGYPGERTLKRLREARASRSPRAGHPISSCAPRQRPAEILRGGRLIAVSLAGRAPPRAAVCR